MIYVLFFTGCSSDGGSESSSSDGATNKPSIEIVGGVERDVLENARIQMLARVTNTSGRSLNYRWTQIEGEPVIIESSNTINAYIATPRYYGLNSLLFLFEVLDGDELLAQEEITLKLKPDFTSLYDGYSSNYEEANYLVNHYEIDALENQTFRITLRSLLGDADLFIYNHESLSPDSLVASSTNYALENDELILSPSTNQKFYIRVFSLKYSVYTLNTKLKPPFLEDGFPIDTDWYGGISSSSPGDNYITLGNIDSDPELEILASGLSGGPLYAWNHDGTAVLDFYDTQHEGIVRPALANLDKSNDSMEVVAASAPLSICEQDRFVFYGNGDLLSLLPSTECFGTDAPIIFDFDNDGLDDIFFRDLWLRSDLSEVPSWENLELNYSFIIQDWDGDGDPEVVSWIYRSFFDERNPTDYSQILVQELDGEFVEGFPTNLDLPSINLMPDTQPVAGDLNKDGKLDLVSIFRSETQPQTMLIQAVANNGELLWQVQTDPGDIHPYTSELTLGDLDGDGSPEVLIQTANKIYAWKSSGVRVEGFPISLDIEAVFNFSSAPLIADVTGDGNQNIVVTTTNYLDVFSRTGVREFHIYVGTMDKLHAIGDIDLDGRNEIVVSTFDWKGIEEPNDSIWAFDLGGEKHGKVEWGQYGGNAKRQRKHPVE